MTDRDARGREAEVDLSGRGAVVAALREGGKGGVARGVGRRVAVGRAAEMDVDAEQRLVRPVRDATADGEGLEEPAASFKLPVRAVVAGACAAQDLDGG